jgi:hypothetical protein
MPIVRRGEWMMDSCPGVLIPGRVKYPTASSYPELGMPILRNSDGMVVVRCAGGAEAGEIVTGSLSE